jgi:4-alpha-glucanotransferase
MATRRSGILLHPSSLPGPPGIGDLGSAVDGWLTWLKSSGCSLWQILPLGPTGFADSPYQCLSSFSLNPLLIDPSALVAAGLADPMEVPEMAPSNGMIDFAAVRSAKSGLVGAAWDRFGPNHTRWQEFEDFRHREATWLDADGLYMALKAENGLRPWTEWPEDLRDRDTGALREAARRLDRQIGLHAFEQWLLADQWNRVRRVAGELGIQIVGDIPLYVAHDSSDVWINRELFSLEPDGSPRTIGGVPPDYFSDQGQRWGNPTYDWDAHRRDDFRWWAARLAATARRVDVVRLDHFRGIADYWAIPASAPTAATGTWLPGPDVELFDALHRHLGDIPLIAEDLGDLSERAQALLAKLPHPGMKILQFAFDDRPEATPFDLDDIPEGVVAYTATHDNDTTVGWYESLGDRAKAKVLEAFGGDGTDIARRMIATAWHSPARFAIAPAQDVASLGSEARMNEPGTTEGNWRWRLRDGELTADDADWLHELNRASHRLD